MGERTSERGDGEFIIAASIRRKKNPVWIVQTGFLLSGGKQSSDFGDLHGLQALGTLFNFELHVVAFVESLVTLAGDRLVVHEYVFTGAPLDEAVSLGIVEPFNGTLFHKDTSLIG